MADLIQFKKGNKANLPNLRLGEPGVALDEGRLYVGGIDGNIQIPNMNDVSDISEARVDADGSVFTTLKERLDTKETQFANEIGILNKKTEGVFSVKEFGAKGDGVTDDTQAFLNCYQSAKNAPNRGKILIPPGQYRLTQPIPHASWIHTIGSGRRNTTILVDHNGAGFELSVGDDPKTPQQGADTIMEGLTIKRFTKPTQKITGNFGIRLFGTLGVTVFNDVHIRDMGDSAWRIGDETGTGAGTGPIHLNYCKAETNLFGYGLDCQGLFADIFTIGFHSWGNAGNFNFDGTNRGTNYYPFQIVIRDTDSEYAGGFTGEGSDYNLGLTDKPLAPNPLPAIRARYIRGLVISGGTIQTAHASGQHCIDLEYCQNVEIAGASDIISRGGVNADAIYIGQGCEHIKIGNVNIYGEYLDHAGNIVRGRYGINAKNVKGLEISHPKIGGFDNAVNIEVSTNKAHVSTSYASGYLDKTYTGPLDQNVPFETPKVQAKAWVVFRDVGGVIELRDNSGIQSVTKLGTGSYQVTFSKAFATSNYTVIVSGKGQTIAIMETSNYTTNTVNIDVFNLSGARVDAVLCNVVAYGVQ